MSVLLLNASFEPLRVVSLRRGLGLVLSGKADLVEPVDGEYVRSTGGEKFEVPAVIRLRHMVKVPFQATVPLSRKALLARDEHRCQVLGCNRSGQTVDHVVPRSRDFWGVSRPSHHTHHHRRLRHGETAFCSPSAPSLNKRDGAPTVRPCGTGQSEQSFRTVAAVGSSSTRGDCGCQD